MAKNQTPYVVYTCRTVKDISIDPKHRNDPFIRYKMPQLNIQIIGNNKMIRTVFLNVDKVAKSLNVPPAYIPNFLAKTIGSQAKYNPKEDPHRRAFISGSHSIIELETALLGFIENFILCDQCRYPELIYSPVKKNCRVRCQSCGWKTNFKRMNLNDKFIRWACNNPPPKSNSHRDRHKKNKIKLDNRSIDNESIDGKSIDGWSVDTSDEAVQQRINDVVSDTVKKMIAY